VLVCGYLLLLFAAAPSMGVVVLALALLQVLVFLALRRRNTELMSSMLQRQAAADSYQVQMLAGIGDLKAAGAEHRAVERWSSLFVDVLNVSMARGRLRGSADAVLATLAFASPLLILMYGAHLTLRGDLTLGAVLASYALAMGFLAPLATLVSSGFRIHLLSTYLHRIRDVLDTPVEQDAATVRKAPRLTGAISLDSVSFRYAAESPLVLDGVTLDVEPGQMIALVGPSGAGKSTLAALLLGLYRPSAGRVLYDGEDLFDLELRSVRRQIAYVAQHPYLFGHSIRGNIALNDPSLPLGRVAAAARRACIHDDVMQMPMGYGTVLADGGASISGGQRQRIALARALVERPAILILDEATSALDAVTEQKVQEEIAALRCTRVIIAHRLSTVRRADRIFVLSAGRLVQAGGHEELASQPGLYADLIRGQRD
jgi:ATP-binding cassette, subfamily B, bacterial